MDLNSLVGNLKKGRQILTDKRNTYYQLSRNLEKSQQKLKEYSKAFDTDLVSQTDFQQELKRTTDLQQYTEDVKIDYQGYVGEINNYWNQLFSKFTPFINTIHKAEQKKRALIMGKIDDFFKFKTKCYKNFDFEEDVS